LAALIFVPSATAQENPVEIEAENFDPNESRGVRTFTKKGVAGIKNKGIAAYTVTVPEAGLYTLSLRYVSKKSRPCTLSINGTVVNESVADEMTGPETPENLQWFDEGEYYLVQDENNIHITSAGNRFPPIDKIRLTLVAACSTYVRVTYRVDGLEKLFRDASGNLQTWPFEGDPPPTTDVYDEIEVVLAGSDLDGDGHLAIYAPEQKQENEISLLLCRIPRGDSRSGTESLWAGCDFRFGPDPVELTKGAWKFTIPTKSTIKLGDFFKTTSWEIENVVESPESVTTFSTMTLPSDEVEFKRLIKYPKSGSGTTEKDVVEIDYDAVLTVEYP